jgi:hypothetical protein
MTSARVMAAADFLTAGLLLAIGCSLLRSARRARRKACDGTTLVGTFMYARVWFGCLALLLLPVVFVVGPWLDMTVACGQQPVELSSFAGGRDAYLPGHFGYDRIWILNDGYVCSATDARKAGYDIFIPPKAL